MTVTTILYPPDPLGRVKISQKLSQLSILFFTKVSGYIHKVCTVPNVTYIKIYSTNLPILDSIWVFIAQMFDWIKLAFLDIEYKNLSSPYTSISDSIKYCLLQHFGHTYVLK